MAVTLNDRINASWKRHLLLTVHLLVLTAAVLLVVWITRDTLSNIPFIHDPVYMRMQFWVCMLFLTDTCIELAFTQKKWSYILANIFFILISIPWLNIIEWSHIHLSRQVSYLLQFIPMIRAGYVLALISGVLSSNKALSMSAVYVIWVIASVYFGSLVFFVEEHYVNTLVRSWWDALWWASLNITTVGCEIVPVTTTGRALSIFLSGEGLMLFPVFTVYVTNALVKPSKQPDAAASTADN